MLTGRKIPTYLLDIVVLTGRHAAGMNFFVCLLTDIFYSPQPLIDWFLLLSSAVYWLISFTLLSHLLIDFFYSPQPFIDWFLLLSSAHCGRWCRRVSTSSPSSGLSTEDLLEELRVISWRGHGWSGGVLGDFAGGVMSGQNPERCWFSGWKLWRWCLQWLWILIFDRRIHEERPVFLSVGLVTLCFGCTQIDENKGLVSE